MACATLGRVLDGGLCDIRTGVGGGLCDIRTGVWAVACATLGRVCGRWPVRH